jgi:integrase
VAEGSAGQAEHRTHGALDEETVALIDRIVAHRSHGRPLPHPRTARPTDYLLTHHGRRLTVDHLRDVLTRVSTDAGLPHITPHQLRHTYVICTGKGRVSHVGSAA